VKEVEWAEPSLRDLAALDKNIARRIKEAVERFAGTGSGNVKRLQGLEGTYTFSGFLTETALTVTAR
jgi:hypothetical protein